ncbi:MAG: autotransporter domain-containing protein [Planctomycetaceae bacterium]|nr:autotransporter domain-containing protein [Planctomycetaceae bacterium]
MSKSVRVSANFAADVNANEKANKRNVQQNIGVRNRFRLLEALRLLVVCVLFVSFLVPMAYAQPPFPDPSPFGSWIPVSPPYGDGEPPGGPPPFPEAAPYQFLYVTEDNVTGGNRYTSQAMTGTLSLSGSVRGVLTGGGRGTHWWIGNQFSGDVLSVTGDGSIYQLDQLTVQGNITSSGVIQNINAVNVWGNMTNNPGGLVGGGGTNDYIPTLNVSQTLLNNGPSTENPRAVIQNVWEINAGTLQNIGVIEQSGASRTSAAYINVANDLIQGNNARANPDGTARGIREAEILSVGGNANAGYLFITVGGNMIQYFDGSVRARGGMIDVLGELYNAGEIRIDDALNSLNSQHWFISANSLFNDGRTWQQHSRSGGQYPISGAENGDLWDEAWGIIYDATIETRANLTNIGINAVINAVVNQDLNDRWLSGIDQSSSFYGGSGDATRDIWTSMLVGGDLNNLDRATILNYSNISVQGNLNNRGATLVGGHWTRHSNIADIHEDHMRQQRGQINVWGNVNNTTEVPWETFDGVFGGLIASFDEFNVHGSLFQDANSMITGSYTHLGTAPGTSNIMRDYDNIYGRRANVLGGILFDGEFDDAASVLNVMGVTGSSLGGTTTFHGLYSQGHIREIDIINVGSSELGILWNALGATSPGATLPDGFTPVGTASTITDIGVINATNLFNEGTISNIDSAINVSYLLVNTGEIDGYSDSHVEWTYHPETGLPWVRNEVLANTRATLRVGIATTANPVGMLLGADVTGYGIINDGTLTNLETISSLGHVSNTGEISNVTSLTVGSSNVMTVPVFSMTGEAAPGADFISNGVLSNIDGITVSRDVLLGAGSSLNRVGTISARRNITVEGNIAAQFQTLSAEGDLTVLGALNIATGAIAVGGNSVSISGYVNNQGLLSSGGVIENLGYIQNDGMISAFGTFRNLGTIDGNGMVFVSALENGSSGTFINAEGGMIEGNLTISGNFQNLNGTIRINDANEIIRVTNDGTARIVGGLLDVNAGYASSLSTNRQYVFLATDEPGNLNVGGVLAGSLGGIASGHTGSVLDVATAYGYWDGTQYVSGREWSLYNQYYWLELQRAYSYGAHGQTSNQIATGTYIDTVGSAPVENSAFWNLLRQLDAISDDPNNPYYNPDYADHQGPINPAALRAVDELSGQIYATIGTASVHNVGVVNRTLADMLRSDVFKFSFVGNPNNAIRGQAIAPLRYTRWGTLYGIGGSSDSDGNAAGYKQSFGGLMAGIDRAAWTGTRLGAWFSAADGDVRMKNLSEKADITSVMVGMYLRQEMYFGYGLASAGFGMDNYKVRRNLTMIGHNATSRLDGNIGTAYLERGIDIPVYYATLQPYASFQFATIGQDRFTEKMRDQNDVRADVGLVGNKARTDSYRMSFGARASSTPIAMRWGQLAMTTNIAWFHEFNDDNGNFVARIANPGGNNYGTQHNSASFKIAGTDTKRDWFNFGFGLHMDRNSTRVFIGSDLYGNGRQTLFSGSGGVITSW